MKRRDPEKPHSRAGLASLAKGQRSVADTAASIDLSKISWTPHLCPKCGRNLHRRRRKKDGAAFLACPDRADCGFTGPNRH